MHRGALAPAGATGARGRAGRAEGWRGLGAPRAVSSQRRDGTGRKPNVELTFND